MVLTKVIFRDAIKRETRHRNIAQDSAVVRKRSYLVAQYKMEALFCSAGRPDKQM